MFTSPSKAIVCILLLTAISKTTIAYSDSVKSTSSKTLASKGNLSRARQANIVYPNILEGQEKYFKEYVEKFATNRRAYLQRTYLRGKSFFPKATAILKKYQVPPEFAVLLALESAFNSNAVSTAGAVGYWQIMDDVAKEYGLKIIEKEVIKKGNVSKAKAQANAKPGTKKIAAAVDERKNFQKSTHTAARYLKDRNAQPKQRLAAGGGKLQLGCRQYLESIAKNRQEEPRVLGHQRPTAGRNP